MPERGRPTYIPGWTPKKAYPSSSQASKRPTYDPNYTPKTATPLRTVEVGDKPGSVVRQTVYTPSDYTPSDMARYAPDSSNKAMAALPKRSAPPSYMGVREAMAHPSTQRGGGGGGGGSKPSFMDVLRTPMSDIPGTLSNLGVPDFLRPSNIGPMVAGAGAGGALMKAGGQAVKAGLSQILPRFVPTVAAAAQRGQQAVSNVASAGQGVIGQAANKLVPTMNTVKNIATKAVNNPAAAGAAAGGIGVAAGGIGLPSIFTPSTSSVNQETPKIIYPTQVDSETNNSLQSQPNGNAMGVPTGGQGIYSGGQNTMTPNAQGTFDQDAFLRSMHDANRPGYLGQGNAMNQPPAQTVAQPEQPPPGMFDYRQEVAKIDELFRGINEQNAALMLKLSEQLVGQLDTLEADLRKQYEQQGSVLDPATQAALKEMRSEVDRRRQGLQEEMNRRGLLQSGIWLQEENRILGNQLTAEEKLLAGRVADIQNRMTDALRQLGTQRINTMGTLAQNQMQNQQWMQGQQINAMNTLNTRNDQWNQWYQGLLTQQRQDAESKRRWDYEQEQARAKTTAGYTGTIPEGYPGAGQPTYEARMDAQSAAAKAEAASRPSSTSLKQQEKAREEQWNKEIDTFLGANMTKFSNKNDFVSTLRQEYPEIIRRWGSEGWAAIMAEVDSYWR